MIDSRHRPRRFSRRAFLAGGTGLLGLALFPGLTRARIGLDDPPVTLRAAPAPLTMTPDAPAVRGAWGYNGQVPGPVLRYRQGDRLRVLLRNELPQATTVHWHGIRLPNAMDGVPHVTQPPVEPGETFEYDFHLPDAGTYWYHSHLNGPEQVARGLSGALIVEEREPYPADRELLWVLDDWRMTGEDAIREDFVDFHDVSHAGRIGNTVTVNGRLPNAEPVRPGERLRLRLINAANARVFSLSFGDLPAYVIALDGQPLPPHEPQGGRVVIGPGMRADVVLDCVGEAGRIVDVRDDFYAGLDFTLMRLTLQGEAIRDAPPGMPPALPDNPVPEPVLKEAISHGVDFGGGMMGRTGMGQLMRMMRDGMAWTVNGAPVRATQGHTHPPLFTLRRAQTCRIVFLNDTAWHHPIHLHGHHFRVLTRNGKAEPHQPFHDTVFMYPGDVVETAFVADNPGDWMFHCHIQEHQAGGMMGLFRVLA